MSGPARVACLAAIAACVAVAGCGYALAGRGNALPDSIRVIGVPDFVNQSSVPDFDTALTAAVRVEFVSKGRYRIVPDANGVDGLLEGTVTNVRLEPVAFTSDNQASRNILIVTANVSFREVATGRVIWANPSFQVRDEYQVSTSTVADASALLTQDTSARERIARSFARSVVTSIFEAF
jgi:hypothetical protein